MERLGSALLTAAAILLVVFLQCKKTTDTAPSKPQCNIILMTPISDASINISYNAQGKVQAITEGPGITNFSYTGNAINVTRSQNGVLIEKKTLVLNNDGLLINERVENSNGSVWSNRSFEYSSTQLTKITRTSSSSSTPQLTNCTWSNGNLVSMTVGAQLFSYEYYADKPVQQGDFQHFAHVRDYGSGDILFRNKNLLKSETTPAAKKNIVYTFDSEGKITSYTFVTPGGSNTHSFQYSCQ